MNYIFVDFEMETIDRCFKAERKVSRMEIIEIGAVMLNDAHEEISSFKRYVKPEYIDHISHKISELTGINDETLRGKNHSSKEIAEFAQWCNSFGSDIKVFAWSESDLKQLTGEINLKNIPMTEELERVIECWGDLQLEFDTSLYSDRQTSLTNALASLGIAFEGQAHDALNDSRNTARLYVEMVTSEDYRRDVEFVKSCIYDENRSSGVTLGDLFDFSKLFQSA